MDIPRNLWVSDEIPEAEINALLSEQPVRVQARYAYLFGDFQQVVKLLRDEPYDLEALFLLAYSHDTRRLNEPDKARRYFQTALELYPGNRWEKEVQQQLKRLN